MGAGGRESLCLERSLGSDFWSDHWLVQLFPRWEPSSPLPACPPQHWGGHSSLLLGGGGVPAHAAPPPAPPPFSAGEDSGLGTPGGSQLSGETLAAVTWSAGKLRGCSGSPSALSL